MQVASICPCEGEDCMARRAFCIRYWVPSAMNAVMCTDYNARHKCRPCHLPCINTDCHAISFVHTQVMQGAVSRLLTRTAQVLNAPKASSTAVSAMSALASSSTSCTSPPRVCNPSALHCTLQDPNKNDEKRIEATDQAPSLTSGEDLFTNSSAIRIMLQQPGGAC